MAKFFLTVPWAELRSGTSQPLITQTNVLGLEVPVPPLAEQTRIVAKVEALLAEVNAARERLAKVPAILKRFRQSVLAAACSGRLTEEWRTSTTPRESAVALIERVLSERRKRVERGGTEKPKSGTVARREVDGQLLPLFDLPEGWVWATWDDLADWITYGFTRPRPHVGSGFPIVTARHVAGARIDLDSVDRTTREAFAALSPKDRPRRGEILFTKDGSIGRAAVVETEQPFCINQSVALVRFGGPSAEPHFLRLVLESPWTQHLIDEGAKGCAIRHISITDFGTFPVPLPSLDEQREIIRRVDALFKIAAAIEKHVATATARADKIQQAILAKAFRGELVPTEAELAREEGREYEPASVLLERIAKERATSGTGGTKKRPKRDAA